jgi:hypothetical protein
MADKKISQLTGATTPLAGTEELPIVQSGSTVKATAEQILTSTQPSGTANGVLYLNGSKVATSGTGLRFDGTSLAVKRNRTGTFQPSFDLYANDLTISANDVFGWLNFYGNDTTSNVFTKHAFVSAVAFTTHAPGTNATELTFGTTPAGTDVAVEQVRIRATGDVQLANGNLVIGTSGKGIDFSADSSAAGMTSELLDDYEEGTWTPVLTIGGTTETIGSVYAAYTKIGRQVTVQFKFSVDSVTGTGNVVVSLPFTATSSANQILMFPIGANKVSWTGAVLAAEIAPSATTFSVVGIVNSTASSAANVTNSNVTTASQLRGAFTYFVD